MSDSKQIEAVLLDHIPAAIVVCDAKGRVAYCNGAATELYGCARGDRVPRELAGTAQAATPWQGEFTVGGRRVHCRASPVQDSANRRVGTITAAFVVGKDRGSLVGGRLAEIGDRIAQARAAAGLTQQQLADRLGVTRRSVQGYESGSVAPYRHLARLSEILGRPVGWFLLEDRGPNDDALHEALREQRVRLERELRRIVREEVAAMR